MRTTPRVYLGTMTFSWSQTSSRVDEAVATNMLQRFVTFNEQYGIEQHWIDTARIYAGGKTEATVGMILPKVKLPEQHEFRIGTKAHPSQDQGLSPAGIQAQLDASLQAMQLSSCHEYYLHQPDPEHSLLESLTYLDSLVRQGKIAAIGMSNYHVDEMERAFQLCADHNLTPPSVYQGLYNPLNRLVEDELLPLLKRNNCSFVAYNPLAAGLLTGKHHLENTVVPKGRFKNNPNYLPRFYTSPNFEAIELIRKKCTDISMVEATYRWLLCHSSLSPNDGVLLGASSLVQLDENLAACETAIDKGSLPDDIVDAFDQAWAITRANHPFPYWRSYSKDMPSRETRNQGASYEATKK